MSDSDPDQVVPNPDIYWFDPATELGRLQKQAAALLDCKAYLAEFDDLVMRLRPIGRFAQRLWDFVGEMHVADMPPYRSAVKNMIRLLHDRGDELAKLQNGLLELALLGARLKDLDEVFRADQLMREMLTRSPRNSEEREAELMKRAEKRSAERDAKEAERKRADPEKYAAEEKVEKAHAAAWFARYELEQLLSRRVAAGNTQGT